MQLGSIGGIAFSTKKLFTPDEISRSTSPRWTTHEILNKQPKSQFLGPGLDTLSFIIRLDARFGVDPRKEGDRMIQIARKGLPVTFALGGKKMGTYRWKIMTVDETYRHIDVKGVIRYIEMNISLEEYAK